MKLSGTAAERFISTPDAKIGAVLVYGPNYGLAHEYATSLLSRSGGEVTELRATAVNEDPAILHDAVYASSLFGGGAPVFIREATDKITNTCEELFANEDSARNFTVFEAGELTNKSKLRAFFETHPHLVAIACYEEKGEQLAQKLKDFAANYGCSIASDALDYIVDRLPGDRAAQRQELEKLVLYVGDGNAVTLKDAIACIGDAADVDVFELPWLVFGGDGALIDKTLVRLFEEATSEIMLVRMLLSHAIKLHNVQSAMRAGQSASSAMMSLKPPVFHNQQSKFQTQLRRWSLPALTKVIALINETERLCKSTGYPSETLVRQLCIQIGQKAI